MDTVQASLDQLFVLISGYMVFMMQCGFAMLTAGSVRTKNTKNVLLKNLLDACIGALAYYIFGFAFAYGNETDEGNTVFIGKSNFALSDLSDLGTGTWGPDRLHFFFFQWTFAATAATIVSGSVAERTSFYAYLGYAFFLSAFVYPVVSHWVWSAQGWLSAFKADDLLFGSGMIDFAGCGVVHMVGGFAGLMGAIIVGPRLGRFDAEGNTVPMPGHSATLCTLGTFILWFGWYGFNPGSALAFTTSISLDGTLEGSGPYTAARCAVTTTLAAASGGLTTLFIIKLKDHCYDLVAVLNGTLAGLVGITASCYGVEPWAALIIGAIAALFYIGGGILLLKLKIDDPLEAWPIHGCCGMWGAFAVGLFSKQDLQLVAGFNTEYYGAFYGGGGQLLGANVVGIIVIILWTCGLIGPFFYIFKLLGMLRISPEDELIGNDISKHGGAAYPQDALNAAEESAQKDLSSLKDNFGMDDSAKIQEPEVRGDDSA